jgi:MtN3 and saliva related transmembrane protein
MAPDTPTLIIGAQAAITSTASGLDDHQDARTRNISTGLYALTVAGFALWLAYGVMLEQWPLIATNSICLVLAAFVLVMKILLASGKRAVADALDPSADGS